LSKYLEVVGKAREDRLVVSGVFKLFETTGLPLEIIIEELWEDGYIPSWNDFYKEAEAAGVGHRSIMIRIQEGVSILKCKEIKNGNE